MEALVWIMSSPHPVHAFRKAVYEADPILSAAARDVAYVIAHHMDYAGKSTPGTRRIRERTGRGPSTIQKAIGELQQRGLIAVIAGVGTRTNAYHSLASATPPVALAPVEIFASATEIAPSATDRIPSATPPVAKLGKKLEELEEAGRQSPPSQLTLAYQKVDQDIADGKQVKDRDALARWVAAHDGPQLVAEWHRHVDTSTGGHQTDLDPDNPPEPTAEEIADHKRRRGEDTARKKAWLADLKPDGKSWRDIITNPDALVKTL